MKIIDKLNKKIQLRLFNKIDKAIDQIKYGLYARINKDCGDKGEAEPGLFAAAVVNELFSLPPKTTEAKKYLEQNKNKIDAYISDLKNNDEVREVLTQAMKIRLTVVFRAAGSGVSDNFARIPYNNLDKKGFIKKDSEIMSADQFIKFAKKYIQSSPKY
jgi:hypothetical protein